MGTIPALAEDASAREIAVTLEGAVFEVSAPRIQLGLSAPGSGSPGHWDTWWLSDEEAEQLARLLHQAAREAPRGDAPGAIPVGAFTSSSEATTPWLAVSVEQRPAPHGAGVLLRFDDELTREQGANARLWLSPPDAERLHGLLRSALLLEAVTLPHVYEPPRPKAVVVATLDWGGLPP